MLLLPNPIGGIEQRTKGCNDETQTDRNWSAANGFQNSRSQPQDNGGRPAHGRTPTGQQGAKVSAHRPYSLSGFTRLSPAGSKQQRERRAMPVNYSGRP